MAHPSASLYGSDRMVLESVAGLVGAGMRVLLTVPEPGPLLQLAADRGATVLPCRTPVLRKGALSPRGAAGLLATALAGAAGGLRLLRRHRPDVVYVSTVTVPLWVLLARLRRIPVLCHVHEAESGAAGWARRVLASPARSASLVLVNSRFAVDVLAGSFGSIRPRARVLLNGVAGPDRVVPPRPRPARPARLLFVGRLSARKGVQVALAATGELVGRGVDVRLDVVGDVYADHAAFADRLQQQAAVADLQGRVTFHGFDPQIWDHLAGCDVLLVPSTLPEPFGNTAVEGVLAARPVVASDIGGLPEALAGYGSARLVPAGDAAALAAAVEKVLADYPAQAALDDAAVAAQRHDPARYRAQVADAVAGLLR